MTYNNSKEFDKELKGLLKKYRSLNEDIETFKRYAIETYFSDNHVDTDAFVKIEGLCNEDFTSYKVRKFACKSLKNKGNRSGIRIIFIKDNKSENITFLEIYYKGDKEVEDRGRIERFLYKNA